MEQSKRQVISSKLERFLKMIKEASELSLFPFVESWKIIRRDQERLDKEIQSHGDITLKTRWNQVKINVTEGIDECPVSKLASHLEFIQTDIQELIKTNKL